MADGVTDPVSDDVSDAVPLGLGVTVHVPVGVMDCVVVSDAVTENEPVVVHVSVGAADPVGVALTDAVAVVKAEKEPVTGGVTVIEFDGDTVGDLDCDTLTVSVDDTERDGEFDGDDVIEMESDLSPVALEHPLIVKLSVFDDVED